MTPAFWLCRRALVSAAAEMAAAFSGARKNRLDLSVGIALGGIALGNASQIALFVTPCSCCSATSSARTNGRWLLVGAVVMMLIDTVTAGFITSGGRSAWFVGVLLMLVYTIFAMTLYLLPAEGT